MLRIDDRGLRKSDRRIKKISKRRNGHTRDGDSVKLIQREQQKRAERILKKLREEKENVSECDNTDIQDRRVGAIETKIPIDRGEPTETDESELRVDNDS